MIYISQDFYNLLTKEERANLENLHNKLELCRRTGEIGYYNFTITTPRGSVCSKRILDLIPTKLMQTGIFDALIEDYRKAENNERASGELGKLKSSLETIKGVFK